MEPLRSSARAGLLCSSRVVDRGQLSSIIEHFIIPDEITWGGTAAGLLLSVLFPANDANILAG